MQKLSDLFNRYSKYLIAAILIIVPLFPKFPLLKIPGTYVAIRFEDLILLLLGLLTLVKFIPNYKILLKDKIIRAIVLFFAIGFVSLVSGAFLTHTVNISVGVFHLFRRVEYMVPFIAALILFKKENIKSDLSFYLKILSIVVAIAFLYGLGQRFLNFPIIITQNEEYSKGIALRWTPGSHINSTFAGHYDLAAFMVLLLPVFIALFFTLKDKMGKMYSLLAIVGGLWLLINSISRIAQVSYLLAITIALFLIRKYKALALTLLISSILIATSSGLEARFGRIFEVFFSKVGVTKTLNYFDRHFSVMADEISIPGKKSDAPIATPTPPPVFEDRSTSIRLKVEWPRALRALTKNPILGTGYSSITLATDNDYLRLLGEVGILGFFAFLLIFYRISQELFKIIGYIRGNPGIESSFLAGMFGAVAGTFLSATFIDLFEASKFATLFWLLLGMTVSLVRNAKNNKII